MIRALPVGILVVHDIYCPPLLSSMPSSCGRVTKMVRVECLVISLSVVYLLADSLLTLAARSASLTIRLFHSASSYAARSALPISASNHG